MQLHNLFSTFVKINQMKKVFILLLMHACFSKLFAQQISFPSGDSMRKGHAAVFSNTSLGGYGSAYYQRNLSAEKSTINVDRFMFFLRHSFSDKITLNSEFGVEDTKVNQDAANELVIEQAYLKFSLNTKHHLVAGMFLPRIGILNENHLPETYFGNERNQVETFILPSNWRHIGIGFYGELNSFPLSYTAGIVNGLNSAAFEHGSGIREGRFEARKVNVNNMAATASLKWTKHNVNIQVSGYYGGSVSLAPKQADSLKLDSGMFGTPVLVGETSVRYEANGLRATILATVVSIPDAGDINRAYANNTPQQQYGTYAELAYNVFEGNKKMKQHPLRLFVRYELLDMNAAVPSNGLKDGTLSQQHMVAGVSYFPLKHVVIKADARWMNTGKENPSLIVNPGSGGSAYQQRNTFLQVGIGYSF